MATGACALNFCQDFQAPVPRIHVVPPPGSEPASEIAGECTSEQLELRSSSSAPRRKSWHQKNSRKNISPRLCPRHIHHKEESGIFERRKKEDAAKRLNAVKPPLWRAPLVREPMPVDPDEFNTITPDYSDFVRNLWTHAHANVNDPDNACSFEDSYFGDKVLPQRQVMIDQFGWPMPAEPYSWNDAPVQVGRPLSPTYKARTSGLGIEAEAYDVNEIGNMATRGMSYTKQFELPTISSILKAKHAAFVKAKVPIDVNTQDQSNFGGYKGLQQRQRKRASSYSHSSKARSPCTSLDMDRLSCKDSEKEHFQLPGSHHPSPRDRLSSGMRSHSPSDVASQRSAFDDSAVEFQGTAKVPYPKEYLLWKKKRRDSVRRHNRLRANQIIGSGRPNGSCFDCVYPDLCWGNEKFQEHLHAAKPGPVFDDTETSLSDFSELEVDEEVTEPFESNPINVATIPVAQISPTTSYVPVIPRMAFCGQNSPVPNDKPSSNCCCGENPEVDKFENKTFNHCGTVLMAAPQNMDQTTELMSSQAVSTTWAHGIPLFQFSGSSTATYQPLVPQFHQQVAQPAQPLIQAIKAPVKPTQPVVQKDQTFVQPPQTFVQPTHTFFQPTQTFVQPTQTFVQPAQTFVQPAQTFVQPAQTFVQPAQAFVPPNVQLQEPNLQLMIPTTQLPTQTIQIAQPLGVVPNAPIAEIQEGLLAGGGTNKVYAKSGEVAPKYVSRLKRVVRKDRRGDYHHVGHVPQHPLYTDVVEELDIQNSTCNQAVLFNQGVVNGVQGGTGVPFVQSVQQSPYNQVQTNKIIQPVLTPIQFAYPIKLRRREASPNGHHNLRVNGQIYNKSTPTVDNRRTQQNNKVKTKGECSGSTNAWICGASVQCCAPIEGKNKRDNRISNTKEEHSKHNEQSERRLQSPRFGN